MPFPFACPHCGIETLVDDAFAGQRGPCAGCGKEIIVPVRPNVPISLTDPNAASSRTKPGTIAAIVVLGILAATTVFTILLILLFPSFRAASDMIHKASCRSNLQRIAEALRQYEIEHGTLPPAYIADATGKPMHSWRVLILPQLGATGVYSRYNFNEPWDGPNNSALIQQMPDVYACPADPDALLKGETSYMVLVGPRTLFPGAKALRSADASDYLESTLLVAEIPVNGIAWTTPKDLNATRMQFSVNSGAAGEVGSYHPRGAHAVMLDGTVRFLSEFFPADYLEGMSTVSGNEQIPLEVFD